MLIIGSFSLSFFFIYSSYKFLLLFIINENMLFLLVVVRTRKQASNLSERMSESSEKILSMRVNIKKKIRNFFFIISVFRSFNALVFS